MVECNGCLDILLPQGYHAHLRAHVTQKRRHVILAGLFEPPEDAVPHAVRIQADQIRQRSEVFVPAAVQRRPEFIHHTGESPFQ